MPPRLYLIPAIDGTSMYGDSSQLITLAGGISIPAYLARGSIYPLFKYSTYYSLVRKGESSENITV